MIKEAQEQWESGWNFTASVIVDVHNNCTCRSTLEVLGLTILELHQNSNISKVIRLIFVIWLKLNKYLTNALPKLILLKFSRFVLSNGKERTFNSLTLKINVNDINDLAII